MGFKKLFASLGMGSASVDTVLNEPHAVPGGVVQGEVRIEGVQTLQEFTERRLAPAMNTCRAVAARQDALSRRVARATALLSTRVDLTRERQNQEVLASMNRRAQQQLKLQETVEGLSAAAIAYYLLSLLGYAIKPLPWGGLGTTAEVVLALAVPPVAALVWLGIRRQRRAE